MALSLIICIFYTLYGRKSVYIKIFISHEARFTPSSNFNLSSISIS